MIERVLIIILVGLVYFAKTLTYKYASDDIPAFNRPKNPNKWIQWLFVLEGRARSTPQVDHIITTLIHISVCVFIYLGFGKSDASFLAAFLFLFNPTNNQGSVWIAGRAYAFVALGMTLLMALPLLAPIVLAFVTYYNIGFASPIIFAFSPYWWVVLALPIGWLIHGKRFKKNVSDKVSQEMFAEDKAIKPEKLALFIKTFGFYTFHSLVPIRTTFYHSFLQSAAGVGKFKAYTIKCRWFWIGVMFILAIGYFFISRPWDILSFALLWWCVCVAPFLNFVRIHQEIAERYCYLPNVGLMVVLASFLVGNPILATVFLTAYATKMWFWMDAYMDDYYLVESSCLASPDAWFAWHVKAMKRWEVKSHQEAVILWSMARLISPNEFKININIATALGLSSDPKHREEAKKFLEIAEKNIPAGQEGMAQPIIDNWKKGEMAIVL